MATNLVQLSIPASSQGVANCVSNASYFQKVTLTWGSTTAVFTGTGEGQPMTTSDGSQSVQIPPDEAARTISVQFEFSPNGSGGPFSMAVVKDPIVTNKGGFNVIEVTSEDSSDNDFNDSYLTVVTVAK